MKILEKLKNLFSFKKAKEAEEKQEISLETASEEKRQQFIDAYNTYRIVNVAFLTRVNGVDVPNELKTREIQVFQYGKGLAKPIKDFVADSEGLKGIFSFGLTYRLPDYACFIPWIAVIAIGEGKPNSPINGGGPKNVIVLDSKKEAA